MSSQYCCNELNDFIMVEDSARETLCAIHKTINSTDNFPSCNHKMLRLCPVPNLQNRSGACVRSRSRKSRSPSPKYDHSKMHRTLSANPPIKKSHCCQIVPHVYCRIERSASPGSGVANYVNVEKTFSCPGKMNQNNPKSSTFTSKSSIQIEQFAQNLLDTDGVVHELKTEIERVKHQLHHISRQRIPAPSLRSPHTSKIPCSITIPPSAPEEMPESVIVKLTNDNKRLKRELKSKKKLLEKSRTEMAKAKDILSDYEKKVGLLHVQALKSSKAMKKSKETFCQCLKDRDEKIKALKETQESLDKTLKKSSKILNEKDLEIMGLKESVSCLKKTLDGSSFKCSTLIQSNQELVQSIDVLKGQLQVSSSALNDQKNLIESLEQKICDLNCMCKKTACKSRKQKSDFDSLIKNHEEEKFRLNQELDNLSMKMSETERQLRVYETYPDKYKRLEQECKEAHDQLRNTQESFLKEKQEMEKLISELTNVVKQNKGTLQEMSELNRQQEITIQSQSKALLKKEEQFKLIEKESEDFKMRNAKLEQEVEDLRRSLSEPCNKEACLCISKELDRIKNALNVEKDTQLIKEKIIQDQSQTIIDLQREVKEKISELNKAQNDTRYLEEEIEKINEKLIIKHKELDVEIDEKEGLMDKLRELECQRNQLVEDISDFEQMLHKVQRTCGDNEKQKMVLKNLEDQIVKQRQEWDEQKKNMGKEKQKAICAAKFATQKLLDTVADFQRQVDAQKKVQLLLTKMLHEKDEQLRRVKSKISSINTITKDVEFHDTGMKELFFHNNRSENVSLYSSCSSSSRKIPDFAKATEPYRFVIKEEEPSKDLE
ncbi:hypothetical protein ABEB36_014248 [Hypothenemus hampei]|uniref:Uncharacterized protein n=1 Tax=Hypothenemus hampei TaxID=57062 RepID=A0ABD1E4N5_HYPHA